MSHIYVPNDFIDDVALSFEEKAIIIALHSFESTGRVVTYDELTSCSTDSKRTVMRIVKSLKEKGYINIHQKNGIEWEWEFSYYPLGG